MNQSSLDSAVALRLLEEQAALIAVLAAEIETLKAENATLKERLNLSSDNSSLPPSQNRLNYQRPVQKKLSGRKPGGQPGHRGISRPLAPEQEVSNQVECRLPSTCPACEGRIEVTGFSRHQVYEVPKHAFEVTEYRQAKGHCVRCQKRYRSELPVGVGAHCLGARAQALIGVLTSRYRLSKRLAKSWLKEQYGLSISLGTVSNVEANVSQALEAPYEGIKAALASSKVIHLDETGYKQKSQSGWAWVMCEASSTLFHLNRSRGKKVAQALVGSFVGRIVVSDRYSAYAYLPDENRQLCWAHLKRNLKRISERTGPSSQIGLNLLKAYEQVFHLWKTATLTQAFSQQSTQKKFERTQRQFLSWLKKGADCPHKTTAGTCKNLLKQAKALWTFWSNPQVPPTNNHAERQLRPLVIAKKLTFGTQSLRGNHFIERLFSVAMTCQQQQKPFLNFVESCVSACFAHQPVPALDDS